MKGSEMMKVEKYESQPIACDATSRHEAKAVTITPT